MDIQSRPSRDPLDIPSRWTFRLRPVWTARGDGCVCALHAFSLPLLDVSRSPTPAECGRSRAALVRSTAPPQQCVRAPATVTDIYTDLRSQLLWNSLPWTARNPPTPHTAG
ncbi:hypothetical protein MRX96_018586 [Rhipicephalus microplus]